MVDPPEALAAVVGGPGHRVDADAEDVFDLADQLEGLAPRPVHLVDEREDGHLPLLADAKELLRLRLDALGAVEEHDRPVDRVERPVRVLAEVGVPRRVEEVHLEAVIRKLHHAGRDGDAALALHLHPVGDGGRPAALRLDRTGELDRSAVEEELLRERGLARVGVRDDRERLATFDFGGEVGHGSGLDEDAGNLVA